MAATGARAARATACRIPRCAARTSSPTPRRRSRRSTSLRERLPVRARRGARRALSASSCRAASRCCPGGPTIVLDVAHNPHAARALAGDARRDGLSPADDRRVRHARRQGHRRRDRGGARAHRSLVRRDAAAAARRRRRARCATRSRRPASRLRRSARSTTSRAAFARRAGAAGEADRIVVFGSFLTVAAALAARERRRGRARRAWPTRIADSCRSRRRRAEAHARAAAWSARSCSRSRPR